MGAAQCCSVYHGKEALGSDCLLCSVLYLELLSVLGQCGVPASTEETQLRLCLNGDKY